MALKETQIFKNKINNNFYITIHGYEYNKFKFKYVSFGTGIRCDYCDNLERDRIWYSVKKQNANINEHPLYPLQMTKKCFDKWLEKNT